MKKHTITLIIVLSLISVTTMAQRRNKQTQDTLNVYREFAQLGQWYLRVPMEINLHFIRSSSPASLSGIQDSTETDLTLYYGKNDFYMKVEGLEQIANDSVVVMVNNDAKMIKLYPNTGQLMNNLQRSVSMLLPDSSVQKLAGQYSATTETSEKNIRRITLQSREKISGTELYKETISITYKAGTYEPISFEQSRRILLPVDSAVYQTSLSKNAAYAGRLISAKANAGNLYFVVRDQTTVCRFTRIDYDSKMPPGREQDRVIREASGNYQPAKGFEAYMVSKEF
ncbi:MAG TPA: hypothetical protein VFI06_03075 [Chitinophagaceae bacterium]|nr:hypothetical protein [Chitinophagaceae bacterium]